MEIDEISEEEISRGIRFIPNEVLLARQAGKKVNFVTECGPNCWYWEMPNGSRVYNFDSATFRLIGASNHRKAIGTSFGIYFEKGAGSCPKCGNVNTNGTTLEPQSTASPRK